MDNSGSPPDRVGMLPTTTTPDDTSSSRRRLGRSEWPSIDGPLGLSHEDSVEYARRFFRLGFLCLPFLWAVNCFYFWPVIRHPQSHHSQPQLRRYLLGSAIGFFLFTAILSSWALTFAIGGKNLFGHVWEELLMYNLADKYGLTGWASRAGTGPKGNMRLTWKWHWTQEEDELLIKLVKRHGPGNWKYIANHVKGRTGMSCRLRWVNHLNPKVDKTPFSEEEQEKLLHLHRDFGNKWSTIVSFFPGRTDNQLKNQYHALISRNMKLSKLSVKKYQFIDFLGVGDSE